MTSFSSAQYRCKDPILNIHSSNRRSTNTTSLQSGMILTNYHRENRHHLHIITTSTSSPPHITTSTSTTSPSPPSTLPPPPNQTYGAKVLGSTLEGWSQWYRSISKGTTGAMVLKSELAPPEEQLLVEGMAEEPGREGRTEDPLHRI